MKPGQPTGQPFAQRIGQAFGQPGSLAQWLSVPFQTNLILKWQQKCLKDEDHVVFVINATTLKKKWQCKKLLILAVWKVPRSLT